MIAGGALAASGERRELKARGGAQAEGGESGRRVPGVGFAHFHLAACVWLAARRAALARCFPHSRCPSPCVRPPPGARAPLAIRPERRPIDQTRTTLSRCRPTCRDFHRLHRRMQHATRWPTHDRTDWCPSRVGYLRFSMMGLRGGVSRLATSKRRRFRSCCLSAVTLADCCEPPGKGRHHRKSGAAMASRHLSPRFYNLMFEAHDFERFLETFNQPPKDRQLRAPIAHGTCILGASSIPQAATRRLNPLVVPTRDLQEQVCRLERRRVCHEYSGVASNSSELSRLALVRIRRTSCRQNPLRVRALAGRFR